MTKQWSEHEDLNTFNFFLSKAGHMINIWKFWQSCIIISNLLHTTQFKKLLFEAKTITILIWQMRKSEAQRSKVTSSCPLGTPVGVSELGISDSAAHLIS